MSYFKTSAAMLAIACSLSSTAIASQGHSHKIVKPHTHAPIGVMGDHMHKAGEFMFSYRFMDMKMAGNQQGKDSIDDQTLVTSAPNKFAGMPNMPATVRIAPQEMDMKMHMLGFMYAPSDDITLILMLNYLDNSMDLTTYDGMMGTNIKGDFSTASSGLSDSKLGMLYRLHNDETHHFHLNLNWQIPTGDIEKEDDMLPPMSMNMDNMDMDMGMNNMNMANMQTMRMRMPYAMQLGTGSHMLEIGGTYNGYGAKNNWGAQLIYTTALEENDENYEVGDKLYVTAWYSHQLNHWLSSSMRLSYTDKDDISGMDMNIMGPVQTANPDNYGGTYFDFAFGLNTVIANKHRVALEYQVPIEHDVNGVQMEIDKTLTLGYQIAF